MSKPREPKPARKVELDRTSPPKLVAPELDESQRRVVAHRGGPLLVLAGPGTGKTTTIVESVASHLSGRDALKPEKILVLTFARKAARTLRERIALRLDANQAPRVATFHSFAFGIVRARARLDDSFRGTGVMKGALRLLSAPEEQARVKKILLDASEEDPRIWGEQWQGAIGTKAFATEVRELLTRARALDVDSSDMGRWGIAAGLPVWASIAQLADIVSKTFDLQGVTDYADLIHWAAYTCRSKHWRAELQLDFDAIYVDEYQDVDPAQVEMLKALYFGQSLVVVGDPDQAIYRFRGADSSAIQRFPEEFKQPNGQPAEVIALKSARRFGSEILRAAQSVLPPITATGLPTKTLHEHRDLVCEPVGRVTPASVRVYEAKSQEVSAIADWLRDGRRNGLAWQEMAVIVRTNDEVQRISAGLQRVGVPAVVASDEIPLAEHQATRPLVTALEVARSLVNQRKDSSVEPISPETARTLLTGPLGDMDTSSLRKAARVLRQAYRSAGLPPPSGDQACAAAMADPRNLLDVDDPVVEPIRWLGALLATAADNLAEGSLISQVLWGLWAEPPSALAQSRFQVRDSQESYQDRLYRHVWSSGFDAQQANRDIDAVISLFDLAKRDDWREGGSAGAESFVVELRSQQFPVESWLESPSVNSGVRVLTAHRAKGLEWRWVAVAGVNEGTWPPMGVRGSLLGTERLTTDGVLPPENLSEMLNEERRLLYVAMTRAKENLLVTAVSDAENEGTSPSRFLIDCEPNPEWVASWQWQTRDPRSYTAFLRRTLMNPLADDETKNEAAKALSILAGASDYEGAQLFAYADPSNWWGIDPPQVSGESIRDIDEPVRLSGSDLKDMDQCRLQWFLKREAKAVGTRTDALTIGSVIHAFARALYTGELPADEQVLRQEMAQIWHQVYPKQGWVEKSEAIVLGEVIDRLIHWHQSDRGRRAIAVEERFEVSVPLEDDSATVVGRVDRLEVEVADEARLHVIDFKTSKSPESNPKALKDIQLGTYRLATQLGAFDEFVPSALDAGAELVQLRKAPVGQAKVQPAGTIDSGWVTELIEDAVRAIRSEDLTATEGSHCRFCDYRRLCPTQPAGMPLTRVSSNSSIEPTRQGATGPAR